MIKMYKFGKPGSPLPSFLFSLSWLSLPTNIRVIHKQASILLIMVMMATLQCLNIQPWKSTESLLKKNKVKNQPHLKTPRREKR